MSESPGEERGERHQGERDDGAALWQHERARFVLALEAAGVGTFSLDADTLRGEWDPRGGDILRADAWRGGFLAYVAEPDAADVRRRFGALLAAPSTPASFEFRVRGAWPGQARWCRVTATAYPGEAAGEAPRIFGTLQDVTEARNAAEQRARLAEELRRATERLARSEALLDGLVELAPVGIGFFDRDLRFGRVNRRLAALNGAPVEAHLGKKIAEVVPGIPAEEIEAAWRRIIATGEPVIDHEVSGTTPATAGEVGYWKESWYPVVIGGETVGIGAIVRDVTDEKRREELQRLLVGIVGHDLRNPLSAISTSVQVLARTPLDERQLRTVERVRTSVDRMSRLIADLLDYTRARGGAGIPLDPVPCRLGDVVAQVVAEIETAHPGRAVVASGDADESGRWDPERLRQVLGNLVGNAVKYGAPDAPIVVSWRGGAHEVVLEVRNRGRPIPPEFLAHIFEPLTQVDPTRRGGVGLGLFITREIVKAHGGEVRATSSEADGTAFIVRLPRAGPPQHRR